MRCLRIYATPDGESHFGEVDIAMTLTPSFPNEAPSAHYEASRSAYYEASRVRFVQIPAGVREAGFHNHRVGSLPFGWMARSSLKRATERGDVSPLERQFSSRMCMGKGISRAIHRKGKML